MLACLNCKFGTVKKRKGKKKKSEKGEGGLDEAEGDEEEEEEEKARAYQRTLSKSGENFHGNRKHRDMWPLHSRRGEEEGPESGREAEL